MSQKLKTLSIYRKNLSLNASGEDTTGSEEFIVTRTEYHPEWEKPLKEVQYGPDGQPEQVILFDYDERGHLLLEELREGDGSIMEKKTYEVDEEGKVQKEFMHYADGSFDTILYQYNDKGQLIEKRTIDDEGEEEARVAFEYDGDHLVRETHWDADGEMEQETIMEYDEDGLLSAVSVINHYESTRVRKEYAYDDKGQRAGLIVFNEDEEPVERVLYTSDEKGRMVKVVDENRRQKNTTILDYDENDNVVKQEEFDLNNRLLNRVERTYDEAGRIQQSKVFIDPVGRGAPRKYVMRNEYTFFEKSQD
jgi:antitoxin component YwqK of YwqJK toxin-antitoxin module